VIVFPAIASPAHGRSSNSSTKDIVLNYQGY